MHPQAMWALLLGASPALAAFEQFYFTGNGGNATAPRRCGDMTYECKEPNMCSRDTLTKKWYCCEPGNKVGPCWTGATKCEGSSADKPSAQQTGCTNLGVDYCCHEAYVCKSPSSERQLTHPQRTMHPKRKAIPRLLEQTTKRNPLPEFHNPQRNILLP